MPRRQYSFDELNINMSASWILVVAAALLCQQALALPSGTANSVADRLAQEIARLEGILKTGALEYGIPVIDPLDINQVPINVNTGAVKANGNLDDILVNGIAAFTVTKLEDGAEAGRVTLAIELPDVEATTTYDLQGSVKYSIINVKLNGKSPVSAKVSGITANLDLDITINSDDSITVDNISNVDFGFSKATVHIDKMSGIVNKLVNQLIPTLVKSNRNKLIKLIETSGKDYVNQYFDMIAGKTSPKKAVAVSELMQTLADQLVVSPDAHRILQKIAHSLNA